MANLLETALAELAPIVQGFPSSIKQASVDLMRDFVTRRAHDVAGYLEALHKGVISKADFDHLIKGQLALAKMYVVTAAGLAIAQFEHVRVAIVTALMNVALKGLFI
ncbi:hypothetical protein [Hansschlegelia sp. KR7-227]|uniref:hypothetical protein n=1 Tax=Hansschlegelia sp. KR7-227 TaxID=3400914 RepID=UPI003C079BD0